MNFRQLEVFRAVIEGGSATRASELLDISQPAISRSISELETSLGFRLFDRVRGRLVVTPEGQMFADEVTAAFVAMDRVKAATQRIRTLGSGHIRIASIAAMSSTMIPRAIGLFKKKHPEIVVTQHSNTSPNIMELVAKGQFDIGVVAAETDLSGVDHQHYCSFSAVCVLPRDHALTSQKAIRPEFLHRKPFISLTRGDTLRDKLDAVFVAHGTEPTTVIEAPNSTAVCALALESVGIGIVNPIAADGFVERGLEVRPFIPDVQVKSRLVFRPDVQRSHIVNEMVAALMEARTVPPTGTRSLRRLV